MVNYAGEGGYQEGTRTFALPKQLADDSFALRGTWALDYQGTTATNDDNAIALNYHAHNVYMVVGGTGTVTVTRDGETTTIPVSGPPNMRQIVDGRRGRGRESAGLVVQGAAGVLVHLRLTRVKRSGGTEGHGVTVHAVTKPGGLRTVVEHVAEVSTATPAEHLGAGHADAVVGTLDHGIV